MFWHKLGVFVRRIHTHICIYVYYTFSEKLSTFICDKRALSGVFRYRRFPYSDKPLQHLPQIHRNIFKPIMVVNASALLWEWPSTAPVASDITLQYNSCNHNRTEYIIRNINISVFYIICQQGIGTDGWNISLLKIPANLIYWLFNPHSYSHSATYML